MVYAAMKPTKPSLEVPHEKIHNIKITLSSKNVKNLEKGDYKYLRDSTPEKLVENFLNDSSIEDCKKAKIIRIIYGMEIWSMGESQVVVFHGR